MSSASLLLCARLFENKVISIYPLRTTDFDAARYLIPKNWCDRYEFNSSV